MEATTGNTELGYVRFGVSNLAEWRECATSISHYYFVESTDIVAAFESIAANINSVRLSQ